MSGSKPGERRGGRKRGTPNKVTAEIKAAFQKHGKALVEALMALTKSDDERVRLGAIQAALDRGWGKASQAVDMRMGELPAEEYMPDVEEMRRIMAEQRDKASKSEQEQAIQGKASVAGERESGKEVVEQDGEEIGSSLARTASAAGTSHKPVVH